MGVLGWPVTWDINILTYYCKEVHFQSSSPSLLVTRSFQVSDHLSKWTATAYETTKILPPGNVTFQGKVTWAVSIKVLKTRRIFLTYSLLTHWVLSSGNHPRSPSGPLPIEQAILLSLDSLVKDLEKFRLTNIQIIALPENKNRENRREGINSKNNMTNVPRTEGYKFLDGKGLAPQMKINPHQIPTLWNSEHSEPKRTSNIPEIGF